MTDAVEKSTAAVVRLTARIEAIQAPDDLLTARVRPLLDDLGQAVKAVTDKGVLEQERVARLEGAITGVGTVVATLEQATRGLAESMARQRADLGESLGALREAVITLQKAGTTAAGAVRGAVEEEARLLAALRSQLDSELAAMRETKKELEAQAAGSAAAITQLNQGFASMTRTIVNAVGR